ncbi:MAG: methylenetetrahydrofolate reductase [NAD(P)H] [Spirochaetaceae bacterium]|nr:MAG: methylenetetrahydrofolate reductase [NAD(P)H] [Spirochaetaceae bacterium]
MAKASISVEVFPPKTPQGTEKLLANLQTLAESRYISVTCGAGGSGQGYTTELVSTLSNQLTVPIVPHITAAAYLTSEINAVLDYYYSIGIRTVLALGGDRPAGQGESIRTIFAVELVKHIQQWNKTNDGRQKFSVGAAGYPEGHFATPNRSLELNYLKQKVDAGGDYLCTQLCFDNHDLLDFRDRCAAAGINVPITVGIMPIQSQANYERIPQLALGTRYPAGLMRQISSCRNDKEIAACGMNWAIKQARQLISEGLTDIHLYSLNNADTSQQFFQALG